MRANKAETVFPLEWPGFPGETDARQQAQADLRLVDDRFNAPVLPADALAVNEALRTEQTAAFEEADASGIYNYEIEMQRPVLPLEEVPERVSWRQRAKSLMGKAGETMRDASIAALSTAQAKAEQFYGDEEAGSTRKKITTAVLGTLALGGLSYLEYKGVSGGGAAGQAQQVHQAAHHEAGETLLSTSVFPTLKPHHMEQAQQAGKVLEPTRITVHAGDNPYTITEAQLHAHGVAHPTDAQVLADDKRFLKLNHISWPNAWKIHVGDRLKSLKHW
jgi:hypothetical protein